MSDAWLADLRAEVAASTHEAVAARMGVARTTVTILCRGYYGANTEKMRQRFENAFRKNVDCPYLRKPLAVSDCRDIYQHPMPANNPKLLKHWTACKSCPLNPLREEKYDDPS